MLMYCYSTYKTSPVGFAIGWVKVPIEKGSAYTELKPCTDNFVRSCFERGFIKNVSGRSPVTHHYYFIVKKLRCEYIDDHNVPGHKICNFLFEFDENEKDKYVRFVRNYDKAKLETVMNDFIVPDSFAETFALKLDTAKLNDYINSMLSAEPENNKKVECDDLCFESDTVAPNLAERFTRIAGCEIFEQDGKTYSSKKNSRPNRWLIPAITAAVLLLAAVAAIFLLVKKFHQ